MGTWRTGEQVTEAAPEVAKLVQARIEETGLAFLATLRRDGFPRISGVEPFFDGDELLIGSMPNSRKGADLRRDPRMALHNASIDKEVKEGDVKVTGLAIDVRDIEVRERLRDETTARTGYDIGTEFLLFRVDVKELAAVRPGGDVLIIASWREGEEPKRVERK